MSTCAFRLRRYACRRLSSASVLALIPSSLSLIFLPLTALIRLRSPPSQSSDAPPSLDDDDDDDDRLLFLLLLLLLPSLRDFFSFFRFFLLLSFFRFFDPFRSLSLEPSRSFRFLDDFLPRDSESLESS